MARRKAPKGCFWRNGTLYGRIQTKGGDVKWSLRTSDPKIASTRREAERARAVAQAYYGDHRRTYAEALEGWEKHIVKDVSPQTLARYATSLGVLAPYLDGLYLDEIDKTLIGEIVADRREPAVPKGRKTPVRASNATIKRDLTALSSVMAFAEDEEWIAANPVTAWLKPGRRRKSRLTERRDPIMLPSHHDVRMVIDRAPGLFAALIEAAWKTGARLEELGQLTRSRFDRTGKQLTIVGKRNKLRVIDLIHDGEDFGFDLLSKLPVALEAQWLFWYRDPRFTRGSRGRGQVRRYAQISSNFRRLVAAVAKEAQKQDQAFHPFRFHDLRHLHAVDWLKSGRSIYVLQHRLGHTSVKTTEMYLQYLTGSEREKAMFARTSSGSVSGPGQSDSA